MSFFLKKFVPALLFLCAIACAHGAQSKPNVVIFLADDLGWTGTQCHPDFFPEGSTYYETPNLVSLAQSGVTLRRAYATPLCSPSRASLMAGQYAARLDYSNTSGVAAPDYIPDASKPLQFPESANRLYSNITTLADYLKEQHGYRTWHIGKWHIGNADAASSSSPVNRGFERQFFVKTGVNTGYFGPFSGVGIENVTYPDGSSAAGDKYSHLADTMTEVASRLIQEHAADPAKRDEPFFLNLWHFMVHTPIQAHIDDVTYFSGKTPDAVHGHNNPHYASMVRYLDKSLGKLIQTLKDTGEYEDTIFVYYSDNGGLGELNGEFEVETYNPVGSGSTSSHGVYTSAGNFEVNQNWPLADAKVSIREGGVRVPAVISYPRGALADGSHVDVPVHLVDIFPTLLDYLGQGAVTSIADRTSATQPLDGRSLRPLLENAGPFPERPIYCYWPRAQWWASSIILGDQKLYRWFIDGHDGAGRIDLYDLARDPGEMQNLAAVDPARAVAMASTLDSWLLATANHPPISNPSYNGAMDETEADYYEWLFSYKPNATSADISPSADLEADGHSNLEEFLFGGNPVVASSLHPVSLSNNAIYYSRPADRGAAATYQLLSSPDLASAMTAVPGNAELQGSATFGVTQFDDSLLYRLPLSNFASGEPRRFFALQGTSNTTLEPTRQSGSLAGAITYSEAGATADNAEILNTHGRTSSFRQIRTSDITGLKNGSYSISMDLSWEDPTNGSATNQQLWVGFMPGAAYRDKNTQFQMGIDVETNKFIVGVGNGTVFQTLGEAAIPNPPAVGDDATRYYPVTIAIDETNAARITSVVFDGQPVTLSSDQILYTSTDRRLVFNTSGGIIMKIDNLTVRKGNGDLLFRDNFNVRNSTDLNSGL